MTHEELYKKNGVESEPTLVTGTLGMPRHGGIFSDNNPYAQQLQFAVKNQDKDALYAKAVEWEANYYNTLEQREYADPMNEIQRQRRAGYNPDLAGASGVSSGSSGSSGSSSSAIPAPQSGVEYANSYGNTESVVSGINAACNVVNTIASFGTATVDAVEKVRTMPSRVSLANTQAYVAEQTKDSIVQSQKLSNVQDRLSLVNQLSTFFTPDSSSDDYVNILGALGIPEDDLSGYERSIREFHTNPAYKAYYEDNVKRLNDLSAYNAVHTAEVQNELYEGTLFVQRSDLNLAKLNSQIETTLMSYLASNRYGQQVGENMVSSAKLEGSQIDFSRQKLDRDVQVFVHSLDIIKNEINRNRGRINEIRDKAQSKGRSITPSEQLEIDTLSNLISQMYTLGSSQLNRFYSLVDNANAITYQNDALLGGDGNPKIDAVTPRYIRTLDVTFGNYVSGGGFNLSDFLSSLIPNVGVRLSSSSSTVTRNP